MIWARYLEASLFDKDRFRFGCAKLRIFIKKSNLRFINKICTGPAFKNLFMWIILNHIQTLIKNQSKFLPKIIPNLAQKWTLVSEKKTTDRNGTISELATAQTIWHPIMEHENNV